MLQPQYLRDFELLIDRDITEHNFYLFTAMKYPVAIYFALSHLELIIQIVMQITPKTKTSRCQICEK